MNTQDFNNFSEAWADAHEVMAAGKILTARAEIVNVVVASTVKSYSGLCSEYLPP